MLHRHPILLLLIVVATAAHLGAQAGGEQPPQTPQGRGGITQGGRGRGGQGGPGRGGLQRPARDVNRAPEVVGTGVIAGRVFAADTGRPVKRARVVVAGGGRPRAATTDEQGRYHVTGLPAASYTITATKTGFVDAAFGQRRALRTGTPVQIADGQQVADADIRLPRGGVITGHIADEDGEPLARALVTVLRYQWAGGEKRLAPAAGDQSDDRGQYRIFGLPPGEYFVSATAGGLDRLVGRFMNMAGETEEVPETTGYAPTYYPGVTTVSDAMRVKLSTAQEITGVDFQLQLVPLATVRGTVAGVTDMVVVLVPEGGGLGPRLAQNFRGEVADDRTFTIRGVPPGRYTAVVRAQGLTAAQSIVVAGADLVLSLVPVPAAEVRGTVTLEAAGATIPKGFSGFRVVGLPLDTLIAAGRPAPAEVTENGSFVAKGFMPGRYAIRATGPRGWILKAVYVSGRDITDEPLDVRTENVSDLNLIFTDRVSGISGVVRDARGIGVAATTVIVFPADPALWIPQSRRIQAARTDQSGAYRVSSLPAGDYLVVASDDVEQGEWFDPEFLDQAKEKAVKVTLGESDQRTQDLKAS